jgi:hypothetical protein
VARSSTGPDKPNLADHMYTGENVHTLMTAVQYTHVMLTAEMALGCGEGSKAVLVYMNG